MNIIDFTKTGGYRFEQPTLAKMQESTFWVLKTFLGFAKVPDVGNFIISGCEISGENITEGIMYIDGEICPFVETAGTAETKIKKLVRLDALSFENGTAPLVWRNTTAVVDEAGVVFSEFVRINLIYTDNNFSNALLEKLNGIEAQAQKNVIPDFAQTNPAHPKYIENKPTILNVLRQATANLGSVGSNTTTTISFAALPTNNYMVMGSIESLNTVGNRAQDVVVWCSADHQTTSFDFMILDVVNIGVRNIKFHYIIIAL